MSKETEKVYEAEETIEARTRETIVTETDRKFLLAFAMIIAYTIILLIPITTSNSDMFKTAAAAISGPLGTIIGYYFGAKKD